MYICIAANKNKILFKPNQQICFNSIALRTAKTRRVLAVLTAIGLNKHVEEGHRGDTYLFEVPRVQSPNNYITTAKYLSFQKRLLLGSCTNVVVEL